MKTCKRTEEEIKAKIEEFCQSKNFLSEDWVFDGESEFPYDGFDQQLSERTFYAFLTWLFEEDEKGATLVG